MRTHFMLIACFLSVLTTSLAADEPPAEHRALLIPTAPGEEIDEQTWRRLTEGFEQEKALFLGLLLQLDTKRIDYSQDRLLDVLAKKRAITELLQQHQLQTLTNMVQPDLMLDYVRMRNATSPRFSGRVVRVGPGEQWTTLTEASAAIRDGDLIQLDAGEYKFPEGQWGNGLSDLALVGLGSENTKISFDRRSGIGAATRWRLASLKVDCNDDPFVNIRREGSLELLRCHIFNYNSGAGGSNAIFGVGAMILAEDCVFEGLTGRAGRPGSGGGDAFDLRGDNMLYLRRCRFIDNSEIVRAAFPCVVDRCTSENQGGREFGVMPYSASHVLFRGKGSPIHQSGQAVEFEHEVDDPIFVEYVLGKREAPDERSRKLAEVLQLRRNVAYWIGLLRHPSPSIRNQAAAQVKLLVGEEVNAPDPVAEVDPAEIETAISDLGSDQFETRTAAATRLHDIGRQAEAALRKLVETGSRQQEAAARLLLDRLDMAVPMAWDRECGALLTWFEERRSHLVWDNAAGKYKLLP